MKIRYKKALLTILLSGLGFGVLVLAIINPGDHSKTSKEANTINNESDILEFEKNTSTPSYTPIPSTSLSLSPTRTPSPTPLPVYSLEDQGYPKINAFIHAYYEAKLICDEESLKNMLNDPSSLPSREQLQKDIMDIEEYQAIKCYVKKSYEKDAYIVYVYNDVKFLNIDTPAPAIDSFYIITDANGDLKIFSGEFDALTNAYYHERNEDADVQKLIQETNEKGEEAKKKDELLKTYWEHLNKKHEETATE